MLETKFAAASTAPLIVRSIPIGAGTAANSTVQELDDPAFLKGWRDLAEATCDRNAFFEPWMLVPALEYLAPRSGRVRLVTVCDQAGTMHAVIPLTSGPPPFGGVWSVWAHTHCFDNTALVRTGAAEAVMTALFDWLARQGASVLVWPGLATDTAVTEHLFRLAHSTGRRRSVLRRSARPLLRADALSLDAFYGDTLSRNRRRGARRRWRRLGELGRVEWRVLEPGSDIVEWCDAFLALEASGWKGRVGTALGSRPDEKAYFEAVARRGTAEKRIIVHSLELDGRPIAMTVNFQSGCRQWAFKVAYDEALRGFAPGVLAEIEGSREAIEDPAVGWVDSCTDAGNRLMAELWPHRRPVVDVVVAVRPGARPDVLALKAGHMAWRALRAGARRFHHAIRWLGSRAQSTSLRRFPR